MKLILWLWILVLMGGNILWLYLDKNPPAWDQAAHLRSTIFANQWLRGMFWGNFADLVKSFGGYPPLIYLIGGFWSLVVGVSIVKITFLNTIFLVGAIIGVYKLSEELTNNKKIALLSGIIFSLLPVIGDISRNMLLDLPLLVWVVWGLYFWIKSESLKINKYSFALLGMLILASLSKLNGFIYFGPIGIILLIENYRNKEFWMKMVIGGAIYALLVGWWWILNSSNIYQYLTGLAGSGEKLTDPMNLGQWQTWIHYFRLFFLQQAGPIVALVFGVSLIFVPKDNKNKKLLWWTVMTYVIFTIIKNKDFRFTMSLLVMVSIWISWGLMRIGKKWLIGLLLIWMGFNFLENGFNWPIKKPVVVFTPTFLMEDVNWINFTEYPVREFRRETWPQARIIGDLEKIYEENSKQKLLVLILMNREELNDNNLGMYKELWGKNVFETVSVGSREEFENQMELEKFMGQYSVILVSEQSFDPAPFYGVNLIAYKQARDYVWNNREMYQWVGEYQMPKYGKVYLVKKI